MTVYIDLVNENELSDKKIKVSTVYQDMKKVILGEFAEVSVYLHKTRERTGIWLLNK